MQALAEMWVASERRDRVLLEAQPSQMLT